MKISYSRTVEVMVEIFPEDLVVLTQDKDFSFILNRRELEFDNSDYEINLRIFLNDRE